MADQGPGGLLACRGVDEETIARLGVLWGKSTAAGSMHLLVGHLLDAAAVGELIWDRYLSSGLQKRLDRLAPDCGGRAFLAWLAGVHDVGKATPAFQAKRPDLAAAVQAAGLTWRPDRDLVRWWHPLASALILQDVLAEAGWAPASVDWVWPLVAGHHGVYPGAGALDAGECSEAHGRGQAWRQTQAGVVCAVHAALGIDHLADLQPAATPSRADQLMLGGLVVMADWIASGDTYFPGTAALTDVSMQAARTRATAAWEHLDLQRGWGDRLAVPPGDVVAARFGLASRPSQRVVADAAVSLREPGLLLIEAPMGEGKTEAALAAAEILAARFGCDGLFVGMPTQATADPMFARVLDWSDRAAPGLQVALLHGKRMFNRQWRALLDSHAGGDFTGVDEDADTPAGDVPGPLSGERRAPAEWFLGRKRGLLAPAAVGTIDQLLFAATRTRHVMLRYAGLAGKVVVLDEVHAADVYMSQFLHEALRWLGSGRVPVVLLSATLPPQQRRELVEAYLAGALGDRYFHADALPEDDGYPRVTAAAATNGRAQVGCAEAASWRPPFRVDVEVLAENDADLDALVALLADRLSDGGCALVIRNTVARAQRAYTALRERFGPDDVHLLHGRFCAADRAEITERLLAELGRPGTGTPRPARRVVVATQVAEQSFDVDVDLLVTDLAPIDLLLQRAGRLHRHQRGSSDRPVKLRQPAVVVTGMTPQPGGRPEIPGFRMYPQHLLLHAAALVLEACSTGWLLPADVPALVSRGYRDDPVGPREWRQAEDKALRDWQEDKEGRTARARQYLLAAQGQFGAPTLAGLHNNDAGSPDDEHMAAVVRDGSRAVEIVLLRKETDGYRSLRGTWLGSDGALAADHLDDVLGASTRLPSQHEGLTTAAAALQSLDSWRGHPWLEHLHILVLDETGSARLDGHVIVYDNDLGLVVDDLSARDPRAAGTTPTADTPPGDPTNRREQHR